MKSLENVGTVTHTHEYFKRLIAKSSNAFFVPENRRNLNDNCNPLTVIV